MRYKQKEKTHKRPPVIKRKHRRFFYSKNREGMQHIIQKITTVRENNILILQMCLKRGIIEVVETI